MSDEKETIEDIVAEIRAQNQGLPEDDYALSPLVCDLLRIADRIEAAAKRERDATREKQSQVGNAAKMREALEKANEKRISDAVIQSLRDKKLEKDREVAEKDNEIARLRAALKPVLDCKVMGAVTAEIEPGKSEYCSAIIEKAQRIYYEG